MRRSLHAVLALFALACAALPQSAAAHPERHAHPALWRVESPHATIYLFGTVHLLPSGVTWFDGKVAQAFNHSDELVTEIVEPRPETMRAIVGEKALLPAGQELSAMLDPADRQKLDAALAANHLPAAAFAHFQPWYAAVALATAPLMNIGYDPDSGVDSQLSKRAAALGRPHDALETAEFQLGLFASLPLATQKSYLMEVVRHLPEIRQELAGIVRAWESGNAAGLAKLMNADEDDPQMTRVLLTDRNANWAHWIAHRLAGSAGKPHETLFLAVGAGHLAGPGSVQDQLRGLGISSRRLQ
ncbi:MAG: TraB/GumN family protein [Sphingomonadales bacterium]|nr:TraB/GumN family protein [Sphingomonadales bacterium]